tara:strand:- start:30 stop:632 length:603 start_codon:yes stop_codon:yes gene_type:complete
MAVRIKDGTISQINRSALSAPALTNLYQVDIELDNRTLFSAINQLTGVRQDWFVRNVGIACYDATLPTSSLATAEVKDNFQGINQQFAHTRFYTDSSFSFYIDKDYRVLLFFEAWMDYISNGANVSENDRRFYRRFRYPNTYKCDGLQITKFDKNLDKKITYQFKNAFPKSIQSIPVSYGTADLLKVSVTFAYDRYILIR